MHVEPTSLQAYYTDKVGEMSWNCSMCRTTIAELGRASLGSCAAALYILCCQIALPADGIRHTSQWSCAVYSTFACFPGIPFASAKPRLIRPALSDMLGPQ